MFESFKISEDSENLEDSSKFLFPKEVYMMFTGTQIKFPAIGGNIDITYHFRNIIDFNGSISYYKEISESEGGLGTDTFYNYHFGIDLLDNVFEGISEAQLYYTQFFTNEPFNNRNSENLLRGAKVGMKLWKNISLLVDVHDVFYDIDLTDSKYNVELIRTATAEIEFRF